MGLIHFNKKQNHIIDLGVRHLKSGSSDQVFEFAGLAGTGKSTVIFEILRRSGIGFHEVIPMAYIGQAAINMRTKGLINAKTIHSWLYEPVESEATDGHGNPILDPYYNRPIYTLKFMPKEVKGRVMFIDEAGTVPLNMKKEIESRGIKIIATGDLSQLPPVADKPAYLTSPNVIELDEIMRQGEGSDILYIADRARRGLPIHNGVYGNVLVIGMNELNDDMIKASNIVICGTNRTRDMMNKRIRQDILGINSDLPVYGDRMVCRKNNWNTELDGINLANGLTGVVTSHPSVLEYEKDAYTMDFRPFLLNQSFKDVTCDYLYLKANHKEKQFVKNRKYAGRTEKFEYGYALTCHLAQGSQYNNGIYISEYLHSDIQNKLDYTGPTRFRHSLIYVNAKRKFY